MDVSIFGAAMLGVATAAVPYIVGGLSAALVFFVVLWGVREAVRLFRDVSEDRAQRAWNDAMVAHYDAEYEANGYEREDSLGWGEIEADLRRDGHL